jgi:hypothetical protein
MMMMMEGNVIMVQFSFLLRLVCFKFHFSAPFCLPLFPPEVSKRIEQD